MDNRGRRLEPPLVDIGRSTSAPAREAGLLTHGRLASRSPGPSGIQSSAHSIRTVSDSQEMTKQSIRERISKPVRSFVSSWNRPFKPRHQLAQPSTTPVSDVPSPPKSTLILPAPSIPTVHGASSPPSPTSPPVSTTFVDETQHSRAFQTVKATPECLPPTVETPLGISPPAQMPLHASPPAESLSLQKGTTPDLQSEGYSVWAEAFNCLKPEDRQNLDPCDIQECLHTMRRETEEMKKTYEKNGWTYTKKDGEIIVLRDIADKVINWIDRFKGIGDVVASFNPAHAALPWAGCRLLLQVITADCKERGSILIGLEYITNLIDKCTIYEYLYPHYIDMGPAAKRLEKDLVRLYSSILIYLSKAKEYYSLNSGRRMAKAAFHESQFDLLMKDIEDGEKDIYQMAQAANMEYTKNAHGVQNQGRAELLGLLKGLDETISRLEFKVTDLHKGLLESERSAILKWLSTVEYLGHHRRARQNRLKDSGSWLTDKGEYKDWRRKSASSLLWLHGIPGAGKTKLVSLVVDNLLEAKAAGSKEALAFFYFDRNEPTRNTPESAMRTLTKQLSSLKPESELLKPIVQKFKDAKQTDFASGALDLEQCRDLILELLPSYQQSNIIIDALDECDNKTRLSLISALRSIMSSAPNLVKIFISSRDDGDISVRLKELPNVRISSKDNSLDIKEFVESEIDKRIDRQELLFGEVPEDLRTYIKETLIQGAGGMFMWVDLQIKNLCDSDRFHTPEDVWAELGKLPRDLEETYSVIFQKITSLPKNSKKWATRTLKWIMCAQRPLSPAQMIAAVSIESDGTIAKTSHIDKETILRFCHNLVVWDSEQDVLRFAHLSVQECLEKRFFKITDAHALAAEGCLTVLCLPNNLRQQESGAWDEVRDKIRVYSSEYWDYHIRSCGKQPESSNIYHLQKGFLGLSSTSSMALIEWVGSRTYTINIQLFEYSYRFDRTPLLVAAQLGLEQIVQYLLSSQIVDVDVLGGMDQTPLSLAAMKGWLSIVQMLLDKGADPNHRDQHGWSVLDLAAANGKKSVVEMLLNRGVDPNSSDSNGLTALHLVAMIGQEPTAKMLLDRGADVNHSDCDGETALFIAARGRKETVKMLLDRGADVNHLDNSGKTALFPAAEEGNESVIKMLLDKGADVNHLGNDGKTALLKASSWGWEPLAKMLLDRGADANHSDLKGKTALLKASRWGQGSVVKMLLDRGADVNHSHRNGKTALLKASRRGYGSAVKVLLDRGANINHSDNNGKTALFLATERQHESVIKILLDNGADPEYGEK